MQRVLALLVLTWSPSIALAGGGSTAALQQGFEVASQRAALAESAVQQMQELIASLEQALEVLRNEGAGKEVDQALSALTSLRGALEVLEFQVKELRADVDQYTVDQERRTLHMEARLAQLETMLGVAPPPLPVLVDADGTPTVAAVEGAGTDQPTTPAASSEGAVQTLDERLALAEARMKDGQQAAARAILQAGLAAEPAHPRAAEALYRLAETSFNENNWRVAARAFQVVTDDHAKSPWAPWAMLRIGECFDGMGRADAARTFYDGVLRTYPGSDAAAEAKRLVGK